MILTGRVGYNRARAILGRAASAATPAARCRNDALGEAAQAKYWSEVTPDWIHNSDAENNESVERLLKVGRPRAAFSCIRFEPSKLDAQVLFRLMSDIAHGGNDQPDRYMLEEYHVEAAFKHLNTSTALTLEQKAGLEFAYIDALARPWNRRGAYGIPNLERYVEAHPELFVQAIVWTYKRKDGAADPAELRVPPERVTTMGERGYKLLDAIQRIPGYNDLGELESGRLAKWIATVRQSSCGSGTVSSASKASCPRQTPGARSRSVAPASSSPTTAAGSSTAHGRRSTNWPKSSTPWAIGLTCSWMAESSGGPTFSRLSPSGPRRSASAAIISFL
jgi:hypothetical protein